MSAAPLEDVGPARSWPGETLRTLAAATAVVAFGVTLLLWDPNFFWIDDMQSGAMPCYCAMARAWQSGEIPLLNPTSWRAGAPACELPAGAFSPSLTACILCVFGLDLPLPAGAAVIALVHLAILAAGAFRLARQRGLSTDLALMVTLVAALNGWIILWGARAWGVCLYSFAWLPWVWWGLEYARHERHGWVRFVPAGLFLMLLIAAGWPHTVLMAGVVTVWLAAQPAPGARRIAALWPLVAAWTMGLGLSAPAWLMMLDYMPETVRGQDHLLVNSEWVVPWSSLPGLVFPPLVGAWNVYGTWKLHQAAELSGGLVPLVILAVCLRKQWRNLVRPLRWEWGLLAAALLLASCPALANFRWSFRWLPLFFLALALVAAHTLALWRARDTELHGIDAAGTPRTPRTPALGTLAFLLVFAVWIRALMVGADYTGTTLRLGVTMLAVCFLWSRLEHRLPAASVWRGWLPSGVLVACAWLTYASHDPFCEVPRWDLPERVGQSGPLDPARRYLSVHIEADIIGWRPVSLTHRATGIGPGLYLGNTAAYSGVELINGYSVFGPRGLDQFFEFGTHGCFKDHSATSVLVGETGPHGLLALLGVDGLIVAQRFDKHRSTLVAQGWHEVATVAGGTVWHRAGPPSPRVRAIASAVVVRDRSTALMRLRYREPDVAVPVILLDATAATPIAPRPFVPAPVSLRENGRHRTVAEVKAPAGDDSADGEVLIVFSRPWFPGYEATFNGQPAPVELCDLMLPAVRVPAGTEGQIVLEYRPRAFFAGAGLAGLTALATALALLVFAGQRGFARRGGARRLETRSPIHHTQEYPAGV